MSEPIYLKPTLVAAEKIAEIRLVPLSYPGTLVSGCRDALVVKRMKIEYGDTWNLRYMIAIHNVQKNIEKFNIEWEIPDDKKRI